MAQLIIAELRNMNHAVILRLQQRRSQRLSKFCKNLLIFFLKSLVAEEAAHKKKNDTVEDKLLKKLRHELKGQRVCITTFLLESVSFMESTSDLYNVAILVLG